MPRNNEKYAYRDRYSLPDYIGKKEFSHMSRYSVLDMIFDKNDKKVYFETPYDTSIDITESDVYHTVSEVEKNRLDIIAYKYYRNPSYWWIIAKINDIEDAFNVPSGTILRITPLSNALSSTKVVK